MLRPLQGRDRISYLVTHGLNSSDPYSLFLIPYTLRVSLLTSIKQLLFLLLRQTFIPAIRNLIKNGVYLVLRD